MSEAGLLFIQVSRQRHMRRGVSLAVGWLYFFADAYPRPKKGGESSPKKRKKKVARFFFLLLLFSLAAIQELDEPKTKLFVFSGSFARSRWWHFYSHEEASKGTRPPCNKQQQKKKKKKKKSPVLSLCFAFHHSTTKQQNKTKQNNPKNPVIFGGLPFFVLFSVWCLSAGR